MWFFKKKEKKVDPKVEEMASKIADAVVNTPAKRTFTIDEGSESQISWAYEVARKFQKQFNEILNKTFEQELITEDEANELAKAVEDEMYYKDDANWWIDTREYTAKERACELLEERTELSVAKKLIEK